MIGQHLGKRHVPLCSLSECTTCPQASARSPAWKLLEPPIIGIFMEGSSWRHDQSLTLFLGLLSSQEHGKWGWKFRASNQLFWWPPTIWELSRAIQFSSVTQSCPTLCNTMNCSMPGPFVHHQLLEFTQTHGWSYYIRLKDDPITQEMTKA